MKKVAFKLTFILEVQKYEYLIGFSL